MGFDMDLAHDPKVQLVEAPLWPHQNIITRMQYGRVHIFPPFCSVYCYWYRTAIEKSKMGNHLSNYVVY